MGGGALVVSDLFGNSGCSISALGHNTDIHNNISLDVNAMEAPKQNSVTFLNNSILTSSPLY